MVVKVRIGEIQDSVNFGKYEVIELIDSKFAKVKFIETGYEAVVQRSAVRRGQVKDWSTSMREMVGSILPTITFGDVLVLEYKDSFNVKVRFLATGHEDWFAGGNIKNGKIQDVMARMSCGVGYIGVGPYNSTRNIKAYKHWIHMLQRCVGDDYVFRNYFDKSVCKEWECFQSFAEWAESQNGFDKPKWQLDKDILLQGNKVYGPSTCCFVPARINSLIIKSNDTEGFWSEKDKRWYFSYRESDSTKVRKGFKDQIEGKIWYAEGKERVVKEVADRYKNLLDERVWLALHSWKAYR